MYLGLSVIFHSVSKCSLGSCCNKVEARFFADDSCDGPHSAAGVRCRLLGGRETNLPASKLSNPSQIVDILGNLSELMDLKLGLRGLRSFFSEKNQVMVDVWVT